MRLPFLALLLGSFLSPSLQAADARDWLVRMTGAGASQSFSGTYIYERSGIFSTHHIWHQALPPASITERLLQLDGQEQEVLLSNGRVRCATRNQFENLAEVQQLDGSRFDVARLEKTYELKLLGSSRVAGRAAVVVLLLPRDNYRYARELHLDSETGLLLKSLLLNGQGQLLERMQFTSLAPKLEHGQQDLQPVTDCVAPIGAPQSAERKSAWQVGWMPAGFVLSATRQQHDPETNASVQSLVFDDGLARFSIFLEPLNGVMAGNAHAQMGPTVVVSRPLSNGKGQFMVTVVGEIPLTTAEQVVLSVTSKDLAGTQP
ncbi:sigma E regulatory protein, MucB/RseB [Pseudomonas pohangensis]|uniref:Sigma E regulatory protein, MucB/RseB n=1 Tax=Pseudomonas pohangensis TaxID=364197 RepID=A0A1H2EPD1_9PSED|nr:MucB/RseB C-terminal domain-containing protein [Pseudomonas pohangensis]SDT96990.1 sigma E regulatory protein, MucB/RseB [Pseudomonas pohangensis]